jgi:hypothetical protein
MEIILLNFEDTKYYARNTILCFYHYKYNTFIKEINTKAKSKGVVFIYLIILVLKKSSNKHFTWQTSETLFMLTTAGKLLLQIFYKLSLIMMLLNKKLLRAL